MARGKTPIERAIDGDPEDRRERYLKALPARGMARVCVIVPANQADALKAYAAQLRDAARGTQSRDD